MNLRAILPAVAVLAALLLIALDLPSPLWGEGSGGRGLAGENPLIPDPSPQRGEGRVEDKPIPPKEAPGKMTLPEGFHATLFAGEPDVVQPIAFCFDDRGRLWVAECYSYPKWHADPKQGKDRILIFEDTDGDGRFDKRTVFQDKLSNVSGIQYGFGGVWVCSTPNLIFIPDRNGDDVPDGPPEIVLDGWSLKAGHNVFNSLTWGPDGWLYGCNGILATSYVGRPGTPDKDRVPINCGVWRYHPTKKKFEVVANGTTNPWGLDFDENGEMFITNCVIDHLWHVIPGAHYQRMYGEDLNPNVYKLMPSICDHIHWGGGNWTESRAPSNSGRAGSVSDRNAYQVHSDAGGGHAHVGCMIYLGNNWPAQYRGGVFMCNLHGNRINHDILERNGSTYVARHGRDFMFANDPWFRGLALQYGPDGGVYVSDWSDTGECHNYQVADQTNGRIYKITYGNVNYQQEDLAKLSDLDLLSRLNRENQWHARHAQRLLQERAFAGKLDPSVVERLRKDRHSLPALWTLYSIGGLDEASLLAFFKHDDERMRTWAVRLAVDQSPPAETIAEEIWNLAKSEPSPLVRLHIAAALQRLSAKWRGEIGGLLSLRQPHENDPYLALMIWYGLEPLIKSETKYIVRNLAFADRAPLVREFAARRLAELGCVDVLFVRYFSFEDPLLWRDILRGVQAGLSGKRRVPMPAGWEHAYPVLVVSPLPEVRERALSIAVQFGDERAFATMRKIVPDQTQPVKLREMALKTLLFQQKPDLVPTMHGLLHDDALRSAAIRGLAAFDDKQTPRLLLHGYPKWNADEHSDVIQTLSSRPGYALALLDAVEKQTIPRADVNSYTIRQLQALKSPEVSAKLAKIWGEIRPASAEKTKLMATYKGQLKPDVLKKANLANGRALYQKTCASCHRLFGEGGEIGPDLTGSQRTNLDYILENVLDPSAIVPREYQVTLITTTTGRTLSGIVKKETDAAVTVQTQNELIVLPRSDIESRTATKVSMMPEGLFEQLRLNDVRDLVGYLAGPGAVPLLKESGAAHGH
jgi:putative membrane-bound dehydrogenase-like protein